MRELGCEIRLLVETRFEHWHVTTSNITSLQVKLRANSPMRPKKKPVFDDCPWQHQHVYVGISIGILKKKKGLYKSCREEQNTAKNWKFLDASCPILELEVTAHHNLIQTP